MIFFHTSRTKGEISTLIVVGILVIAGAGILMTSTLNSTPKTTGSYAQTASCPMTANPQLVSGGICQIATGSSTTLVCALIDYAKPAGSQLVAGQDDPITGPLFPSWNISNGTGTVKLHKQPSISFTSGTTYRIVVYQLDVTWKNITPADCIRTTDISGDKVAEAFNTSATQPTATPVQPTPTNTPAPNDPTNALAPNAPTNTSVPDGPTNTQSPTNPNNTLTPTNSPPTVTPTPPCRQANFVYCPETSLCVPALAECEGVPTNTPVPQPTNPPTNQTPMATPIPTQNLIYIPFLSLGDSSAPIPIPTVAFSVTTDVTTQTFCSDEVLAVMAKLGITKPVICIK